MKGEGAGRQGGEKEAGRETDLHKKKKKKKRMGEKKTRTTPKTLEAKMWSQYIAFVTLHNRTARRPSPPPSPIALPTKPAEQTQLPAELTGRLLC